MSLNFAAFRSALERGERLGAGPVIRAWRRVLLFASRWFQIESLYRFNAKFQPTWVPRFLVYPHAADLPADRDGRAGGRGVPHLAVAALVHQGAGVSTLVMGVVNVTPDSFSDGGEWFEPDAAVAHGLELLDQGADLLDVGGESTRPGAERPTAGRGAAAGRCPVVAELAGRGARISVDTMRAEVAARALEAGASVVNDVSGGLADPDMAAVVAGSGATYVAMHWRAHSARHAVARDVRRRGAGRVPRAGRAGGGPAEPRACAPSRSCWTPGFGFAKLAAHNWRLLAHLDRVQALGFPVLVGTSRKSFLGRLGVPPGDPPRPATERDAATAATTVLAGLAGAWGVRVHHVPSSVDALRVVAATEQAR